MSWTHFSSLLQIFSKSVIYLQCTLFYIGVSICVSTLNLVSVLFAFDRMFAGCCFSLRGHSDWFALGFSDPEESFSKHTFCTNISFFLYNLIHCISWEQVCLNVGPQNNMSLNIKAWAALVTLLWWICLRPRLLIFFGLAFPRDAVIYQHD